MPLVLIRFPRHQLWVIFGAGTDKDCEGMLEVLSQWVTRLVLVQSSHSKATPIQVLQGLLSAQGVQRQVVARGEEAAPNTSLPEDGFKKALEEMRGEAIVLVVCGSFYVVSEIRAHLAATHPKLFQPRDPVWKKD